MHSPRLLHPVRLCLYGFALLTSASLAWGSSTPGLDQPEPVGAYFNGVFPNSPPGDPSGWAVENAFPNLTFTDPMTLQEVPGQSQFLVVGKNGQIWRFPKVNPTAAQKVVVLDHTAKTETSEDQGFYSLAFHPQFATSGAAGENKVYVCYNRRAVPGVDDNDRSYWTVSRFTWVPATGTLDPNSEYILISQYDPHRFHNGGSTFFGDDGFLYITAGDGGLGGDGLDNSQRINMGLFGGILRIDVNNDPTKSHAIRRQPLEDANWWLDNPTTVQPKPAEWPASFTQGYGIPNDNPWLDATAPYDILEEFYAIGLRSPHSAHFDSLTDDIWVGEVGEANREELIRVTKGANCQWSYLEGTRATSKTKPNPLTGFDQPPHWEYDHSVGNSIITGPRYRGTKWASLTGKVIFGDHVRGKIWSATVPASGAPVITEMYSSFDTGYKKGLCGFFTDSGGDIYIMNLAGSNNPGGTIMKLGVPAVSAEPPQFLSQTGVFTNLSTLATATGVIPYDVPNPLWSDAAAKKRWIILPNDGSFNSTAEDIVYSDEGNWTFPAGTVFVKHFETNTSANNPNAIKRLETRFLICTANGGKYGFTYKWNAAGTDAELLHNGESENYNYTTSGGGTEQRTWSYPSRGDCMVCHNDVSGQALGVKTATFASKFHYPSTGRTANQLETFNALGAFNVTLAASQMENATESRALSDESAPLEHRIRSYLATNCSHCHQPNGAGAGFDARLGTPLNLQNIVNGIPERYEALGPDGRYIKPGNTSLSAIFARASAVGNGDAMPPLAKNMAHTAGIAALQTYISGLNPTEFTVPAAPKARYVRVKSLSGNRNFAAIREFQVLDGSGVIIPFGQLSIKDVDSESGSNTASKIIDGSLGSSNLWQTVNVAPVPNHPHQVTIDMGSVRELGGYVYYPRLSSNGDGRIAGYQILISEDYVNWTTFDSGTWSLTSSSETVFAPGYNKRTARTQLAGPTVPVDGNFEATVVFDQDVTGFTSSDITVQNGTVTALRGAGYYYVASISPIPGVTQVNVSIPADAAVPDPLGSLAASKGTLASQPLSVTILPDSQAPTSPGNLQGTPGLFSVQLSWTASSDNVSVTEYQVWRGGSLIATVPGLSYTDNSVAVETQYQYQVIARDAQANSSTPAGVSVTTLADTQAPSTPGNLNGTPSLFSIQLSWNPSSDNLGVTDYQVWRNGTLIATVPSPGYTDNDRTINTQYNYGVVALDAKGNASTAATLTISTLADTQAPTVPGSFGGTPGLASVQLSWTASTDNVGVSDYEVKRNGTMIATVSGLTCTDNDLLPNTGYTYQVRAIDGSGNKSNPAEISVTTLADTMAPSVPGSLAATPGLVSVQLTWNASTDNLGVTGYQVKRNGATVATVPGPGYTDNDLDAETLYAYEVRALDGAGNASGPASVSTTTLADSSAPTMPENFNGTPNMMSVELSWSASTDNLGVTGYRLLREGQLVTTVPGLSYVDSGLEPDTTYHYQLVAVDAKGNTSPMASVYMITLPDTQAPGAPGDLQGTPDFRSVALTWDAAEDNVAVTGYKVFRNGNLVTTVSGLSLNDTGLERDTTYHYEVKAVDEAGNLSAAAGLYVDTYGFEEWLEQYELSGQTGADSDHGGVDNLTEYYLEMNPTDHHDDQAFKLVAQPQGADVHVVYPPLKPAGNYHLHYSTQMSDLSQVSKRISTLSRAQIEAMSPAQRGNYSVDVPKEVAGSGFFLLIFEPPAAE